MFDLSNLNDYEFELLCKDIMEIKLDCLLHTFPKGPDGGIDICDSKKDPQIIIQAKHYINSKYSDLIYSLKKEVSKVEKLSPNKVFINDAIGALNSINIIHYNSEVFIPNISFQHLKVIPQ